jgi:hypothetical protein
MVEVAVGFLAAYLARKAAGLLDRVGSDVDRAFDARVGELYEWVKGRLTGRRAGRRTVAGLEARPEDEQAWQALADQVADEADGDHAFAERLAAWVAQLEASRPPSWGVSVSSESGPAIGGDVVVHAEGGSAAAVQMGDVRVGGDPSPPGRPAP